MMRKFVYLAGGELKNRFNDKKYEKVLAPFSWKLKFWLMNNGLR